MSSGAYGAIELKRELDRPPTDSELHAVSVQEIALRWRTRSAGEIFPATVDSGSGGTKELAVRVGIAPQASCSKALDAVIAKVAVADGCTTVLRATYLDKTQTLVTTVGVAVFPDEASVWKVSRVVWGNSASRGVRAVAFPGTLSARFRDAARQRFFMTNYANYLIFVSGGYADGRPKVRLDRPQLFMFGDQIAAQVGGRLQTYVDPCTVKGVVTC
ncbi:hypothetical protein ABZ860_21655 [Microbispora sp. NPDC046973]|uniref:hypothetical protein n=1 Tax=Microbispora sp. NPDC046973 TaxID=3155022 RepID=UPI0033E52930